MSDVAVPARAAGPSRASERRYGWREELTDLARAATGGLLFGIPLLYTMEVWWTGQRTRPAHALILLAAAFVIAVVCTRTAGFRRSRDAHLLDAVIDAVEALALSLIITALVLVLLREIEGRTTLAVALTKATYQAVPFSVGVGVARTLLAETRAEGEESSGDADDGLNATMADIGATVLGAVLVSGSIAPTDEVPMLDAQLNPQWLLALVAASLVISYAVVFVANFTGQHRRHAQEGLFQHPITETVICYLVSLVCALAMLWAFHRTEGSFRLTLTHTVVLGLPATIGGAAGRLAV